MGTAARSGFLPGPLYPNSPFLRIYFGNTISIDCPDPHGARAEKTRCTHATPLNPVRIFPDFCIFIEVKLRV